MSVLYRPGRYCDVAAWIDGRLIQVTSDGSWVRCFLEDDLIWQQGAAESLLWCRGAVQGNLMLTVHQGQSGTAHLIGSGLTRSLGPTFGVQPVGIDAHEAYVIPGPAMYRRFGLTEQSFAFPPNVPPDSSQGISDVQPDGTLWFADVHRSLAINGVVFSYPNVRGPVTVGQVDPPGIAAAINWMDANGNPKTTITRVIEGDAFEPHVAVSFNGRVAICARTPKGAAYVATTMDALRG